MRKHLLLEIGTEEMPANLMADVTNRLRDLAEKRFAEERISTEDIKVYATPRRLAVYVQNAEERAADEMVKKRGPSVKVAFDDKGNPTKAAAGFAKSMGIESADLVREGEYMWAETVQKGKILEEILPDLYISLITGLTFTRSMRWADEEVRFVRPIRWLVALCGEKIVPLEFAHVRSGRVSRGHRFLCKEPVEIRCPEEYLSSLRRAFVVADQDERRNAIKVGLTEKAAELEGEIRHDEGLLEEINYLVEYPTVLYGRIDEKFLELPAPAVVTPMRDHQRYYPVYRSDGTLMPCFLTVRNGGAKGLPNVRVGNERVLRARLEDAKFFFDGDRKKSLAAYRGELAGINYQEGIGTMLDKAERLSKLTAFMGREWKLTEEEKVTAERASFLSKSDLATGMVREFTELQGEMGMEYALLDGEDEETARAIFEQYLPRFSGDELPTNMAGRALSVADKLDNVAATFLRGHIPTGSQDPFALRRQAIGIIHILTDGKIHWDFRRGIRFALDLLPGDVSQKEIAERQIEEFILQRMRIILTDKGIEHDVIDAVSADNGGDVYDVALKAESMTLCNIRNEIDMRQAVTRLINITKGKTGASVKEELMRDSAEKELCESWKAVRGDVMDAYAHRDYGRALPLLRTLTKPIHAYLDSVMVMVEDDELRQNRISLLTEVLALYTPWGDFSQLA